MSDQSQLHGPLVTIAIPMYNAEHFIERTLRSVLEQSYKNIQVLVYDNSSTDASRQIVESILDPRLKLITSARNYGPGYNFNRCLQQIDGKYFKLVCADDLLYPRCIEEQVAIFEDPQNEGISLVACGRDIIDSSGKILTARSYPGKAGRISSKDAIKSLVRHGTNRIGEPMAGMVPASIAKQVSLFRDKIPYVIDVDFWMRVLQKGDLYFMQKSLCAFRISSNSWSARIGLLQFSQYAKFIEVIKKENEGLISFLDVSIGKLSALMNCAARVLFFKLYTSSPKKDLPAA